MRLSFFYIAVVIFSCCSSNNNSTEASDIVWRDDIAYQNGKTSPYSGKIVWLNEFGKKEKEAEFIKGIPSGIIINYYEDETIFEKFRIENGVRNGKFSRYYENKTVAFEGIYSNDLLNGEVKEWYDNGNKKIIAHYENGKKNGNFIAYHSNSTIVCQGNFEMGGLIDLESAKTYWDNGNIAQQAKTKGPYVILLSYNPQGKIIHQKTVGSIDNKHILDFDGETSYGSFNTLQVKCMNCDRQIGGQGDY